MNVNMDSFKKDPDTGAVINNDDSEYKRILAARANIKKAKETSKKVDMLEQEMKEIKKLLLEAIGKNNV